MVHLYIVTPCSRPNSLDKLYASIDFSKIQKWYIIYDNRFFPFEEKYPDHPQIRESSCNDYGVAGHQQRNIFLNKTHKSKKQGLFCFLDDDNIMHPNFWNIVDKFELGCFYTFDQARNDHLGPVLPGNNVKSGSIDTAAFVIDFKLVGNILFDVTKYDADGGFMEAVMRDNSDKHVYIPETACYYNFQKWDQGKFDYTHELQRHEYGIQVPQHKFDKAKLFVNRNLMTLSLRELMPFNPVIAEIGVYQGFHSDVLIDIFDPKEIVLMDTYNVQDSWTNQFTPANHYQFVLEKYRLEPCAKVVKGLSWEEISKYPDNYFDYIYIDGDHSYEGVVRDIIASMSKIKDGAYIQFNDYTSWCMEGSVPYGILRAVNELLTITKYEVYGFSIDRRQYNDIVIKVIK
jgi:hypothetical protein